jgi:hypothetical protein
MIFKSAAPKESFKNRYISRRIVVVLLLALLGAGMFLESCAAQRCDCTDLSKRYTPPKRVHRLQRQ